MISYEKKIPEFCTAIEDANRYYEFIPQSFPRVFSDGKILALQANTNSRHILIGKENKELAQKIKNNLTFSYPFIEETSLPMKTSVTKNAVSEEDASFVLYAGEETENKITTSDGVIDAETGTKVHKILEHFDFSATDISNEINRVITSLGEEVLGITEKDLSSLNSVLKSPIMSVIKKSKLYREQYFVIKAPANEVIDGVSSTENVMLQGVIDLLAIDGDKAYIIDYKYSAKNPENIVKTYAKQLSLYKTAVENALKIKVEKTVILNLFYGQQIDINL
jgi:ATP-dependent helicase/nuclease subunit A